MNGIVDFSFTIDMIVTFFSAQYFPNNLGVNDDRRNLAAAYIKGWFFIDFFSVFPFERIMTSNGDFAGMAKIFRVSKLYKIVKIMRLIKVMKLM